ncbi:CpsD/CapB family tyrosine-protein kinase [Sporosarcina pasteurii]|uniref:non-specific protein-tyrosine kinase n=1 Tax=Sporosarcina pasteurii TaxID=1474 RepID=A0A380BCL8_SPOPA|nr:CpsD/CapB family tyrosine-protein kinase [Sporosarcina pasteurii]MDS9472220.1 CpsD/CapB family tyrosine-protein kinase [Sporosarcina pasteurii]QBQ06205.1 polysaccharide biosynthesis tyrosine autokinase [Sporosarcina pasteurii]SUI99183.1 Tyrosine-protein kinase YwqD [Sporosarcina pasteurii]
MFFNKKKKQVMQAVARKLITRANPKSVISEQFRTLRTNVNFSMPDESLQSLLITSASPSEGKSTVAANTAVVFAQEGKKVLLIDADMRKPTVHYTFHMTNTLGLSNLLTRQASLADVTKMSDIDNLDVITCGPIPPNPAELLGSKTMDTILQEVKQTYDIVIFDAPPVLSVTDAQILANKADGTILVLYAGQTEKESIVRTKEALVASQGKLIGAVLNNYIMDKDHYYYQYYGTEE